MLTLVSMSQLDHVSLVTTALGDLVLPLLWTELSVHHVKQDTIALKAQANPSPVHLGPTVANHLHHSVTPARLAATAFTALTQSTASLGSSVQWEQALICSLALQVPSVPRALLLEKMNVLNAQLATTAWVMQKQMLLGHVKLATSAALVLTPQHLME